MIAEATPDACQHCNGLGWTMSRISNLAGQERLWWNVCHHCNRDGTRKDIPVIADFAEYLRRKRGER